MNQIGIDIIGEINLFKDSSRKNPLLKEWWGIANLKGKERKDSYYIYIYLTEQDELKFGQTAKAEFKYKFSDVERFKIKLRKG